MPITFFTDEGTAEWLTQLVEQTEAAGRRLDRSLIVHRIVKQARDAHAGAEAPRAGT